MNLHISYSVKDDEEAVAKGYKFLGAAYDKYDGEIHVFDTQSIENIPFVACSSEGTCKEEHNA